MLQAYNCCADGPSVELGPLDLSGALALIAERWPYADVRFETAEEAVEKTIFGFYRDDQDFIEINLAASNLITVRSEIEREGFIGKIFGRRHWLIHLHGRSELESIVAAYFASTETGLEAMQRYPNEAIE